MTPIRLALLALLGAGLPAAATAQDYVERFDTPYNSITVQRTGEIVELQIGRAHV